MSIQFSSSVEMENVPACNGIQKVTIDGEELNKLRKLVPEIMTEGDKDGLAQILDTAKKEARDKGVDTDSQAMALNTIAVKRWIDFRDPTGNQTHFALFDPLAAYHLQPHVSQCRINNGNHPACNFSARSARAASPDFFTNLSLIQGALKQSKGSLQFYLIGRITREVGECAFFGIHEGVVALTTQQAQQLCQKSNHSGHR